MKKYVIKYLATMLWLLLSVPVATAQSSAALHFTQGNDLEKYDIVKKYHYPSTIASSVIQGGGLTLFYYNDSSGTVRSAALRGYTVLDFEIDNDSVFFCGLDNDSNGIIGFFDIEDVYAGSGQIYVANSFRMGTYHNPNQLYKLITYFDTSGRRHVVCVGKTSYQHVTSSCIVDMYSEPLMGFISYSAGRIDGSRIEDSQLDIVRFCTASYPLRDDTTRSYLPCDYLVTAGFRLDNKLCLRFYDAQDPLSSTGPQGTLYTFGVYSSGFEEQYITEVLLSAKTDSSVAVASVFHYPEPTSYHLNLLNISEINIYKLIYGAANSMMQSKEINILGMTEITKLSQFVYNTNKLSYAVLLNGLILPNSDEWCTFIETTGTASSIVKVESGYISDTTCGEKGYTGMDLYNSNTQYVLFGHCRDNNSQCNYGVETSGSASECMPHGKGSINSLNPPTSYREDSSVNISRGRNTLQAVNVPIYEYSLTEDCNQ